MIRFGLFGIGITVEPLFWLSAVFLNARAFDAGTAAWIPDMAAWVLVVLISVLWHELGHALAFVLFGYRPEIVLQAFGGYATAPGAAQMPRWTDVTVSLAGPVFGLLLFVVPFALQLGGIIPSMHELPEGGRLILMHLLTVNLIWSVLNLLPIFPLDGGRVLFALFGPRRIRAALITTIAFGVLVGIFLALYWFSYLFLLFVILMTYQNYQRLKATGFVGF